MKEYDNSLDAIKGISCILMIIAHIPIYFNGNERLFQIIASLAPVLFFAVSGVTTTFQVQRKSFRSLAGFYVLFAVIGFSYNLMWRPDVQAFSVMDVPQIIALGVLSVFLLEKYVKPPFYLYLLLALVVFAVHYFIGSELPDFPLKSILFTETIGFTYFPWMFAFAAGIFAYRCKNIMNLIVALAAALFLSITLSGGVHEEDFIKYNMSMKYLLLSLVILFGTFYVFRRKTSYSPSNLILYLGKHSFLFLFTHLFFILAFDRLGFGSLYIVLMWCLVFACTYVSMRILLWLNRYIERYLEHPVPWVLIVIATVAIPLVISNRDLVIISEAAIGIIFSLNYKKLSRLITLGPSPRDKLAHKEGIHEKAELQAD
ncbi:hypothetical protein [Paenibacillus sp. BAC0078]